MFLSLTDHPDPRRPRGEDGFTLMELLVTVAIMGIIVTALTGVVISYLKTTTDTKSRMTESLDLQFATAYWQRDVSSVGVRSKSHTPGTNPFEMRQSVNIGACASIPSGSAEVVTLAWSEFTGSLDPQAEPETVKVTYVTRPKNGRLELIRVRCGPRPSQNPVAHNLSSSPVVTCEGGGVSGCNDASGKVPARISMQLSISDAEGRGTTAFSETIIGERRQT